MLQILKDPFPVWQQPSSKVNQAPTIKTINSFFNILFFIFVFIINQYFIFIFIFIINLYFIFIFIIIINQYFIFSFYFYY